MWDMRYPKVSAIPGLPPVVINPIAAPGTYQVRLTVDGQSQTQSFEMKANPNEIYSRAETDAKADAWMALYEKAEEGVQAVLRAQAAREKVAGALEGSGELASQAKKVDRALRHEVRVQHGGHGHDPGADHQRALQTCWQS